MNTPRESFDTVTGPEDVRACYAIFLGREPESEDVVTGQAGRSLAELAYGFLASEEYRDRIGDVVAVPQIEKRLPVFIGWTNRLPLTDTTRWGVAAATSVEELRRALLSDPEFATLVLGEQATSGFALPNTTEQTFRLRPLADIRAEGADAWRSTGQDPQLIVETPAAKGFVRFGMKLCFPDRACATYPRQAQLFAAGDYGIREEYSWTVDTSGIENVFEETLFLESAAAFFRLDPSNQLGLLEIKDLSLTPISEKEGRSRLLARWLDLARSQPSLRVNLPPFADMLHRDRWLSVSRRLTEPMSSHGDRYQAWIARRKLDGAGRRELRKRGEGFLQKPMFSILMPTWESDLRFLEKAVASVIAQTWGNWELCICDDGSRSPELATYLAGLSLKDPRIRISRLPTNQGISAATNFALENAKGDFIALLDHDDELAPHALFAMAHALQTCPEADFFYSDEDKMTPDGERYGPFFKPDWSPEFMLGCMYTCHLGVYRTSLVRRLGGFRSSFDLAQDYDLALRVAAQSRQIVHVPDVLYHWRALPHSTATAALAKPTAEFAARRAVQAACDAAGLSGQVVPGPYPGTHRVQPAPKINKRISIVIPTAARRIDPKRKRWWLLDLIRSIYSLSTHRDFDFVVVHNGDLEEELVDFLSNFDITYVHYNCQEFNIAEKMNLGVENASSSTIVLLNDDMVLITPNWLQEMLIWLDAPGVVGVGAKLLFPSGSVQHAGVLLLGVGPGHVYYNEPESSPGLAGSAVLVRNYTAVTGACLMVRKADYQAVGGFDPEFRIDYNDVDFCLKLGRLGRLVYTPFARLTHFESVSKDPAPSSDIAKFKAKWANVSGSDPMYNRNLSGNSSVNEISAYVRPLLDDYPTPQLALATATAGELLSGRASRAWRRLGHRLISSHPDAG